MAGGHVGEVEARATCHAASDLDMGDLSAWMSCQSDRETCGAKPWLPNGDQQVAALQP